jgi:excisionase family DNA binding protein
MPPLSTDEVAAIVGIGPATLERWLAEGKLDAPGSIRFGKRQFRNWTKRDIARVKAFKAKFYRKGRGRKKASSSKHDSQNT